MSKSVRRSNLSILEQVRVARRNPGAAIPAAVFGGFIPFSSFWVAHFELKTESIEVILGQWMAWVTLGALVFSAKTVWQWSNLAFSCPWKATGAVVLFEGVMVGSKTLGLSIGALAILIGVNGLATACTIALSDKGRGKARKKKRVRSSAKKPQLRVA